MSIIDGNVAIGSSVSTFTKQIRVYIRHSGTASVLPSSSPGSNQLIGLSRRLLSSYSSMCVLPRAACLVEEFDLLYGVGSILGQGSINHWAPLLEALNEPLKVDQEGSIPLG